MNPIPPQAYTKDTLLQAYAWLQDQDSNIREIATTPDLLVSLYLKASRDGSAALNRPSIQNFKSELKTLSALMGELERPKPQPAPAQPVTPPVVPSPQEQPQIAIPAMATPNLNFSPATTEAPVLDDKSMLAIKWTKDAFNLSSDAEALRYLIQVGYSKSKSLLP